MHRSFGKLVALALYVVVLLSAEAHAQVTRGSLTGMITDGSDAAVPGAQVSATETATGSVYRAVSNGQGEYTIPFLNPGTYNVNVKSTGFKAFERKNIVVAANEHVRSDAQLQLGAVSEEVTVNSENTLLETSIASTGQVLDTEDINNMPVNGRTPMILGQLAYGAITTANPQFNHPFDNSGPSSIALGGGASKKNEILLDGSPDGGADGTLAYSPPMDAVAEVKVETFQADAAYGHTSGGTINQVTRSGTNTYHGTLYEFLQVSALNDTPWFTKAANAKKSVTRFNQYGGTFGGPVVVPKIYNGHDKMFVFFAYEGIQDNTPSPSIISVPTDAEKRGDFSALAPLGSSYTIYDPYSGVKQQNGRVQRMAFPGNVINRPLNPVGVKLASYFGEPNIAGKADGENNYYYPGNSTDSFDSELGRVDFNLGQHDKLSYNFRHNYRYHASGNAFNNIATGSVLIQPNWGSTVDEIHTFTPNIVWDNRANWTRNTESRPLAATFDFAQQLGFPEGLYTASTAPGFPVTSGTKYVDYGYSKGDLIPFDQFQVFSNLNVLKGKHSLAFGADLRLLKQSSFRYGNSSGLYGFGLNGGQGWTNGPFDNSAAGTIGQELAALLLGLPTSGSFDINTSQISQAKYLGFFVQDNYRILPTLTLNLGLRYERDLPTTEHLNRSVNGFAFGTTNPINTAAQAKYAASPVAGVTFPVVMGGLTFASSSNPGLAQTPATNFSPRIGFAWTPEPKMSVRGGFGIFDDSIGRVDPIASGYNQTTTLQASLDGYQTPYATLSNPFPTGLIAPAGNSQGLSTFLGQAVSFYPQELLNSYAERWDLDIQQTMPGNVLFEMGYVGEHGVHVGASRNIDYVPAQYLSVGQSRNAAVIANLTANVANPFAGLLPGTSLNGSTVQKQQLLLPYPEYTGITETNYPSGFSLFDELEARLEKRMSHGVRFLVNYSWSKRFEGVSYLNPQDIKPEKRIAADDRPQHLVLSGTWELPFGEGRRFGAHIPVANYIIGGWNLTGIYTYQPLGAPLAWGDVIYLGSSLNDLHVNPHAVNGAFDVTQFDRVSGDQPQTGTHIRTLPSQVAHSRQDGINSLDLSIIKSTKIFEHLHGQLRADFFNALNHPNFNAPNLTPTSSAFGTITSQANLPRTIQVGAKLEF